MWLLRFLLSWCSSLDYSWRAAYEMLSLLLQDEEIAMTSTPIDLRKHTTKLENIGICWPALAVRILVFERGIRLYHDDKLLTVNRRQGLVGLGLISPDAFAVRRIYAS